MLRFRWSFLLIPVGLLVGYFCWNYYCYRFDTSVPEIEIFGIVDKGAYAGEASIRIKGYDAYKIDDLSIFIDEKPLISTRINARRFERSIPLPTETLQNGDHTLRFVVKDASRNRNECMKEIAFTVDNLPLNAAIIKANGDDMRVFQGKTLHMQVQVNKPIESMTAKTFSQSLVCACEAPGSLIYDCYIPVSTEESPNEYLLTFQVVDRVGTIVMLDTKFQVIAFPFKKQNLALESSKIQHENDTGLPIAKFEEDMARVSAASPKHKLWKGDFYAPVEIKRISTEFGVQRTTLERGRYQHNAVDIVSTPKCVIWAPQEGRVVIKERYAHSGNTIVLDHGCGICSLYFHLHEFGPLNVGDMVKKGSPLGKLGMTGYANGYHLHWELRINNVAVDPMQWIDPEF